MLDGEGRGALQFPLRARASPAQPNPRGRFGKGAMPPPSVLGAMLVEKFQAGLVEGGGLLDEVHVASVGNALEL